MRRGWPTLLLAMAGCEGGTPPPAAPRAAATPRTSLVLYLTDTLRADRLSAYGFEKPTSPRLEEFAREAILFEDAWAVAPWTRPAVAALLTGVRPAGAAGVNFDPGLHDGYLTLAEALRAAGYRTGAVVANHVVNERVGFSQGFEAWNDGPSTAYGSDAGDVVERGLRFVDGVGDQPFFLYLHTMEPHHPHQPSAAAQRLFSWPAEARPRGRRAVERLDILYQGELWDNDQAFGALVDGLRARGQLQRALVVFTADHGEEFLDHGGKGHGHKLYQELLRIPLAVRLPDGAGASRSREPVSQVDLFPSLLSLLGVAAPASDGRDLAARWLGRATPETAEVEFVAETRLGKAEKEAIRVGNLKLIVNLDHGRTPSSRRGGARLELYDLDRDPREQENLAARRQDAVARLEGRLRVLRSSVRDDVPRRSPEWQPGDREELRALGYVE